MNTPIKREDIRKGDRVRFEFDDRDAYPTLHAVEVTATRDVGSDYLKATRILLVERPVALPTVPGYYLDNEGGVWYRQTTGANNGNHWKDGAEERHTDGVARNFAPFTLLRPVAEVAAEVLADVQALMYPGSLLSDHITALAAKWATK